MRESSPTNSNLDGADATLAFVVVPPVTAQCRRLGQCDMRETSEALVASETKWTQKQLEQFITCKQTLLWSLTVKLLLLFSKMYL